MKRTVIGGFLTLAGTLWCLYALLMGRFDLKNVTEWYTPPGRYGTALLQSHVLLPLAVGALLLLAGIVILGIEFFTNEKK